MPMQIARSSARRTPRELKAIVLAAMLWAPLSAHAAGDDPDASMFSFSGFGTLGVVHSSEDRADFTTSIFKPTGAGYTHSWSGDVDTVIGGQVNARFTPKLSAMVQLISEQQYDKTYRPYVEWANIKYQFSPEFSVRIGRIVLPVFMVSDTRKIGYANPWIRPPLEVYSIVPVSHSDGVDASYSVHIGKVAQTLVGTYGQSNVNNVGGGSGQLRDQWNIVDTIEYGVATVRLSYAQTRVRIGFVNELFDVFRQFGAQGAALADRYDADNKAVEFLGFGAMYDPGRWFVMGEWAADDFHSALGRSSGWYASSGYRLAKFTPYLTYGKVKPHSNTSDPGFDVSTLPPFLAGPATGLNAVLNSILKAVPDQQTISFGVRWDFLKNADLKLQYDHTRLGAGSPGTLTNVQPGFQPGGVVNLFSAAIDFVL